MKISTLLFAVIIAASMTSCNEVPEDVKSRAEEQQEIQRQSQQEEKQNNNTTPSDSLEGDAQTGLSYPKKLVYKSLDEVKKEAENFTFTNTSNLRFECSAPKISAEKVYTLTMNDPTPKVVTDKDKEKLIKGLDSVFGIKLALADIKEVGSEMIKDYVFARGSNDRGSGLIYNGRSTFKLMRKTNFFIDLLSLYDIGNKYTADNYPDQSYKMLDGKEMTIFEAINVGNDCIAKLKEIGAFDDGEEDVLTHIITYTDESGTTISLHYRQVRYGLEVDDGGFALDTATDTTSLKMRSPLLEIVFVEKGTPLTIDNYLSDGVHEKQEEVNILTLSSAVKRLSTGLAQNLNSSVYDVQLRYCCAFKDNTEEIRTYRPMWCFTLSDPCKGKHGSNFYPLPRKMAYVDALNGDIYYSDPQRSRVERSETE